MGYYISVGGKTSDRKALMVYTWVVMTAAWNICGAASDLVVVCMTVSRSESGTYFISLFSPSHFL